MDEYRFNDAAGLCYQFVWHEFCDWYLETAKEWLYSKDEIKKASVKHTLQHVLLNILKLLHPFMPFITEEIWQRLPGAQGSIMKADFPEPSEFPAADRPVQDMELIMN